MGSVRHCATVLMMSHAVHVMSHEGCNVFLDLGTAISTRSEQKEGGEEEKYVGVIGSNVC